MSEKTQHQTETEGHEDHGPTGFQEEGLSISTLGVVVGFTVVFVLIAVVTAFTLAKTQTQEFKMEAVASAVYPELRDARAASTAKINKYQLIDSESGVFQIPIDQAKEILLNEAYLGEASPEVSNELLIKKP